VSHFGCDRLSKEHILHQLGIAKDNLVSNNGPKFGSNCQQPGTRKQRDITFKHLGPPDRRDERAEAGWRLWDEAWAKWRKAAEALCAT
jgi:hypothetical protein